MHDIIAKNTDTSKRLYGEVVDYLRQDEEYSTYYSQLKEMYKDKYNNESTIEEEAVAKALQTKFGNQEEVTRLVNYKPTLARKIYDWVVDKLNNITGGRIEKLYWEDVRNKFERAYSEEYNGKRNQAESRYSIETDKNGNQYVKVNTDQDIFEGIEEKDYNKVAKMYIQDYLMGETTLSKNNTAIIDRKSANKYTNPGKKQQNFTEKMQLTPELKNVLSIAQKESASLPTKDTSKYSNWEYYKFKFELSGKSFEGTVNIGIDSNGNRHFYEINKIKEVSDISGTSLNRSNTSSIDNSITSTNENVNTTKYSMQKFENNANSDNSSNIKYSIAGEIGMKNAIQNDYSNRVIEQSYNQALQLKDRKLLDKVKDSVYNYFDKKGGNSYEVSNEKYQGNKRENNSEVSKNVLQENGEGLRKTRDRLGDNRRRRLETEKSSNKKSSLTNENIDTYLEKRIGKTGTRTTLKELKLNKAENADSFSSKQKKKVLNPNEISQMGEEEANTTPKKYKKGNKESNFYKNITEDSQFINEDLRNEMAKDENIKYYQGITNKETLEKAYTKLLKGGEKETLQWLAKENENVSAEDVAEGWILLKQYQDNKDYSIAVEVAKKMRSMATNAGQTIQAYNILSRLTPEETEFIKNTMGFRIVLF